MEITTKTGEKVNIKTIEVYAKVGDMGRYILQNDEGNTLAERENDYVPDFFPGRHYGDYLMLEIDIETGQILNWQKPSLEAIAKAFDT